MKVTKRDQQKAQTRQRILDVAYSRFSSNGIEKTNTADIAKEAKLSHGAIFVHFKTRQDIVLNVIDRFGVELREQITQSIGRSHTPKSVLLSFTKALASFEDFYVELLIVMPKMPDSLQGSFLMVQNALAYQLLPVVKAKLDPSRYEKLGEDGIMNSWFAQLHYFLSNRHLYVSESSVLEKSGTKIVNDYLTLLGLET
ncbi:MAG: TetR/AcrR family transcriptional regulator [Opitutales bacterium]|nr:TetR/AcrR family transcriptional regulator [Opitutales bacterium]